MAYGNGGQGGTWYANSPLGVIPPGTAFGAGHDTGTALQKFVDSLPGLGSGHPNNLGNYIPVATKVTDPSGHGDDYYEFGIVNYTMRMHTNLPATTQLRGYQDLHQTAPVSNSFYLGPAIIAQRNKPVRIKFTNQLGLSTTPQGQLPIPVDTTLMGAGKGPDGSSTYTQNRTAIHLHGGFTPWISDGTPYQWFTPAGETATYKKGASFHNVPDMPDPLSGSNTIYYTNQQSSRLMFYHDHAVGITRLNVYAGLAAGYLLTDPQEEALINAGDIPNNGDPAGVYRYGIPLVIQDKTFVPNDIGLEDNAWNTALWGNYGNLWFPHVYEPNQSQTSPDGANATGRWDYGPWVWPNITAGPGDAPLMGAALKLPDPATLDAPWLYTYCCVPEAFMDTPIVNGCAYPYLVVPPTAIRFRILNACNDRMLNLQLYQADTGGGGSGALATATVAVSGGPVTALTLSNPGSGYKNAPGVYITGGSGSGATAVATLNPTTVASLTLSNGGNGYTTATVSFVGGGGTGAAATAAVANGMVTGLSVTSPGSGYTSAPCVVITGDGAGAAATANLNPSWVAALTLTNGGNDYTTAPAPTVTIGGTTLTTAYPTTGEVKMVPAVPTPGFPDSWPTDGRDGGVPDPTTVGPSFYQIGSEGGFLPQVATIPNTPINYNYNRRDVTVLNVLDHSLYLGPAERADVILDFSRYAGKTIILYNDAPAPLPGFDPRYDYYTGDPDQTDSGGAPSTLPGFGPNTRTVMQFRVNSGSNLPFDRNPLQTALPTAYVASQPPPIVPETFYPAPYQAASDTFGTIQGTTLTYTPLGATSPITVTPLTKAIIELFDTYGRMNATLGVELTNWNDIPAASTGYGFPYIDPPNDILYPNRPQIWKITHNGVDTHAIHFHLVNVQLINRVGWDGMIKPPDPNERGWKETIRMNPLEVVYVAMKATRPVLPFAVPNSVRLLNPSMPYGSTEGFSNIDPATGQAFATPTTNVMYNFGWEYVWHCHLLGHEENDMMRPLVFYGNILPIGALDLLLLQ